MEQTVKVVVYKSIGDSGGWIFVILHRGRSDEECKDFGNKLLNRELAWVRDEIDDPGYFSAEVVITR